MRWVSNGFRGVCFAAAASLGLGATGTGQDIGDERAVPMHLGAGEEFSLSLEDLLGHGGHLFTTKWTRFDGMGRPFTKGTGTPLADPAEPLLFPRNFNRLSSPESTSCAGCHADPGPGGSGEFFTNAFVLAERFDFATFDPTDAVPTKETADESGAATSSETIGNTRSTPALFGAGYVEMLAREITIDLQAIRNSIPPDGSASLRSKGLDFGTLTRAADGTWVTTGVVGIPGGSLATSGALDPPSLVILPFSHAGATVSIRQFTVGAFNHHLGVQASERVGDGLDIDQDGVADEATRGDVTAVSLFQATLPPPGRVIPKNKALRSVIQQGEHVFVEVGCASCHVPCLPLTDWTFTEPNPFNPQGMLQEGDAYHSGFGSLAVDLTSKNLPLPRLVPTKKGTKVIEVFAFTDMKLHDITSGLADPNREPLDMHEVPGTPEFFAGNSRFLTARLWGVADGMPYFHHGKYTTLRDAIEAHAGEASGVTSKWKLRTSGERNAVIEFLKSLRVLPEKAKALVVDPNGKKAKWTEFPWTCGQDVPPLP